VSPEQREWLQRRRHAQAGHPDKRALALFQAALKDPL